MYPTLFTIGDFRIASYTILLDLGLILGLLFTYLEGKRRFERGTLALDLGLWVVIGGILGGRIAYVLANWRIFSEDWASAFRIWEGGLAFHGAILGGLLVMVVFAYFQGRGEEPVPFLQLADVLTPGLALGIVFGWAACLLGGCAYGVVGDGFCYAILPDLFGVEASRFATQAVGLGVSFLLFLGVWLMRRRWPFAGAGFLLYGLLYFAVQFFLEFTRGDEAIYLGPWRLAQVLNLVLALAAGVGLLWLWWQWRNADQGQPDITEEGAELEASGESPGIVQVDADEAEAVAEEPAEAEPTISGGADEPGEGAGAEGEIAGTG